MLGGDKLVGLENALKFLNQSTSAAIARRGNNMVYSESKSTADHVAFNAANEAALNEVAAWAVAITKRKLSTSYPPSSLPGQPPHRRTGTLMNSIHWRAGKASREFPGPVPRDFSKSSMQRFKTENELKYGWYKKIVTRAYKNNSLIKPYPAAQLYSSLVRVIEVDPNAPDDSDRKRLEYYSYYLETGWMSQRNKHFRDKGNPQGAGVDVPSARSLASHPSRGGWNPPRPFLKSLATPAYRATMNNLYRDALRRLLPPHLRYMADKATLKVEYNHSLRVPYVSSNKGLLD